MTNEAIIKIITDAEPSINKTAFSGDADSGNRIGCNQFRKLATSCLSAECYEEIELQVLYNQSKVSRNGASWKYIMADGKTTLADLIVSCMQKVRSQSDELNCMKDLSLFFGYFYRFARIWADQNPPLYDNDRGKFSNNNRSYQNRSQNNGGFKGNNNRGGYNGRR